MMRAWGQPLPAAPPPGLGVGALPQQDARATAPDVPEPPRRATRVAKQLVKTRICKHHARGFCRYADKCDFAHDSGELGQRPNLLKTKMCVGFLAGSCDKEDCTFAHGLRDLRSSGDQGGPKAAPSVCSQASSPLGLTDQRSEDSSFWLRHPSLRGKGLSAASLTASTLPTLSSGRPHLQGMLYGRSDGASSVASTLSGGPQLSSCHLGEGQVLGCPEGDDGRPPAFAHPAPPTPWASEDDEPPPPPPQWALGLCQPKPAASAELGHAGHHDTAPRRQQQPHGPLGLQAQAPPRGAPEPQHAWGNDAAPPRRQQPHGPLGPQAQAPPRGAPEPQHAWGAAAPAGAVGDEGSRHAEAVMQVQQAVFLAAAEAAQQVLHQVLPLLQGSEQQQQAKDATVRMLRGLVPAHQGLPDQVVVPAPPGLTDDAAAVPQPHGHFDADAAAGSLRHGPGARDEGGAAAAALGTVGWPASLKREILANALGDPAWSAPEAQAWPCTRGACPEGLAPHPSMLPPAAPQPRALREGAVLGLQQRTQASRVNTGSALHPDAQSGGGAELGHALDFWPTPGPASQAGAGYYERVSL